MLVLLTQRISSKQVNWNRTICKTTFYIHLSDRCVFKHGWDLLSVFYVQPSGSGPSLQQFLVLKLACLCLIGCRLAGYHCVKMSLSSFTKRLLKLVFVKIGKYTQGFKEIIDSSRTVNSLGFNKSSGFTWNCGVLSKVRFWVTQIWSMAKVDTSLEVLILYFGRQFFSHQMA